MIRTNRLDLLERLADDLAHEIKNPLHSMVINLEVLKRRMLRSCPEGQEELLRYAGVLTGELERVSHRIEVLLRLMRPTRNGESTTLNTLVEDLMELLELEGGRRSVEVRFEPALHTGRAYVPREPTRQALLNLIFAVLDRLGEGGTLRIRTDLEDATARLIIDGVSASGGAAAGRDGANPSFEERLDESRVGIARTLGTTIGAWIEVDRTSEDTVSLSLAIPVTRS